MEDSQMWWRTAVVVIWILLVHSEQAFSMLERDTREKKKQRKANSKLIEKGIHTPVHVQHVLGDEHIVHCSAAN
jgi:hypothetical protein